MISNLVIYDMIIAWKWIMASPNKTKWTVSVIKDRIIKSSLKTETAKRLRLKVETKNCKVAD